MALVPRRRPRSHRALPGAVRAECMCRLVSWSMLMCGGVACRSYFAARHFMVSKGVWCGFLMKVRGPR